MRQITLYVRKNTSVGHNTDTNTASSQRDNSPSLFMGEGARGWGRLNQPINPIKRRRLVTLRQRGIVEDRVDEVIHRAAEGHHRLPDVDQLARALRR